MKELGGRLDRADKKLNKIREIRGRTGLIVSTIVVIVPYVKY